MTNDLNKLLLKRRAELTLSYERLFRSQIIAEAILLEGLLDRIIASYFCPDQAKHPLFYSFLFRDTEVTFSSKCNVVRKLLKRAFPPLAESFAFFLADLKNSANSAISLPTAK